MHDWNLLRSQVIHYSVAGNKGLVPMGPTSHKMVHEQDIATIVAGLHTSGEHNYDRALGVKA